MDGKTDARVRLDPGLEVSFPNLDIRKGDTLGNLWRFRSALRSWRPDVLVTCNWGAIEWAMANALVGVRHIHIEDGFGPEERDRQLPRRALTRRIFLRRSTVVLPSRVLEGIARDIWKLPASRLRYVPNGVDLARFGAAPGGPPPWAGYFAPDVPVIGTVAALRPEKNLARLLEAFALVLRERPAGLVIAGGGAERDGLERLATTLGVEKSVFFTGHIEQPQGLYGHFDLFALSSDTEQMPLSVLEAMASGLAVASTKVGDVAAMITPGNLPYMADKTAASLAGAMRALLAAPGLRGEVGQANRARAAAEYGQERMFETYRGLIEGDGQAGRAGGRV